MAKKSVEIPVEYTAPLYMNGLQGRMLYVPANYENSKEVLIVYDRLGSLEQWWELVRVFNRFGSVTKTDLPGFGGMESFYKIHEKPTIDRLADYMAAFIKLRFKRKRLTIVGIGFGFVIVTRMLQRYPDVAKRVNLVISIGGYSHKDDFRYNTLKRFLYKSGGWIGSQRVPAPPLRLMGLRSFLLKWYYSNWPAKTAIIEDMNSSTKELYLEKKIDGWQKSNLRTHLYTLSQIMRLDNCNKSVDVPLWHIHISSEDQLNEHIVEQHLRVIYRDYHQATVKVSSSQLTIMNIKTAAKLLPAKLRKVLSK